MSLHIKVKALNLLSMTDETKALVLQADPESKLVMDEKDFDFVCIFHGKAYFYSVAYINAHTLDELQAAFAAVVA